MATETTLSNTTSAHTSIFQHIIQRQTVRLIALTLFVTGLAMRLYTLNLPFDRDTYDEGVYWQSLRAMAAGYHLYQQIFYAQPPFFLLASFPIYALVGQTLWSARLAIVLLSLAGLIGIFLLGKAVRGWSGGLVALLLIITAPLYLSESQTLQADAPSAALATLAVGLAYLWWKQPSGRTGVCYAVLTTLTLALGILSKLLAISALVPIGLLAIVHTWRIFQGPAEERISEARSLLAGCGVFVLALLLLILPFAGSFSQLWELVVTYHNVAGTLVHFTILNNTETIRNFIQQPLVFAAFFATLCALLRRDWYVLPLLAWFITTLLLLWRQIPLFPHHFVALIPPLVALVVVGIGPLPLYRRRSISQRIMTTLMLALILLVAVFGIQDIRHYYRDMQAKGNSTETAYDLQVAQDLQHAIRSDQLVITDAQFLAGLANRNAPAELVDTSSVRIQTGYLTDRQLIQMATQSRVRAILFYSGRFSTTGDFHSWVAQHFRLVRHYNSGRELWLKL